MGAGGGGVHLSVKIQLLYKRINKGGSCRRPKCNKGS